MEQELESQRQTYQLCRLGFGILAASLILACFTSIVSLMPLFGCRAIMIWIVKHAWWNWIGTPVVWGCLIGTYLLWGRWTEPGWQRRVILLIAMELVDVMLWALEHGEVLGAGLGEVGPQAARLGHEWLRDSLGQALGWGEFALIAGLAGDLMAHLGVEPAREASRSTRSLAATGAVVWMIQFCLRTSWARGWPLLARPIGRSPEILLLYLGSQMIWTITLIQVTALTIAATRETSRTLAEMDLEYRRDDLFPSPSESFADLLAPTHDGSKRGS
jgi:hypothetical protein